MVGTHEISFIETLSDIFEGNPNKTIGEVKEWCVGKGINVDDTIRRIMVFARKNQEWSQWKL